MRRVIKIFVLLISQISVNHLNAQSTGLITYSDTFISNTTYCPTDRQYDNWGQFRAKLDTSIFRLLKVSMRGSFASTPRVCSDSFIARKIAAALYNPSSTSSYTVMCGGNTWVVGYIGSCMSSGCTKITDNVGIAADGANNACACLTPSWQIRPTIGNSNWGGVNSVSCNPPPSQRMTLEFGYRLYDNDAGIIGIQQPDVCKNPNNISCRVKNFGGKQLDSCRISWSLNGTFQSSILLKKALKSGADSLITIKYGVNFTPNNFYDIKIWSSNPNGKNDQFLTNDTLKYSFTFLGSTQAPNLTDSSVCGSGNHLLTCKPFDKNDVVVWYGSRSGNNILGTGTNFLTDWLSPGTYKLYAGATRQIKSVWQESNFAGGNQQSGFMLDLKASQGLNIDSLAVNIGATFGTPANIEVYSKDGTYVGYENSASAWTLVGKYTVSSRGTGAPTNIPAKLRVEAGKTTGLYVQTTNAPNFYLQYGNGSNVYNDGNLQIITGAGIALNWGGMFSGRNGNIRFYYKKVACLSARDSMILTVVPKVGGAGLLKGIPFESPDLSTTGSTASPDLVATLRTLSYDWKAPSGYLTTDYGKKWTIRSVQVTTASGRSISNMDTLIKFPSLTSNGYLKIKPGKYLEDSIISIRVTFSDLLNNTCDTQIIRKIYVAPTPIALFNADSVCFGVPTAFKNKSTIKKGNLSYKWYFGTGDSSQFIEPFYTYKQFGGYPVKLVAISNLGITKDTTIQVNVNEIPNLKFRVVNACEGDSIEFVNTSTISKGNIVYAWAFGDGTFSVKTNPRHLYKLPGDYVVELRGKANGCSNLLSKKANQFVKPKANFTVIGNCAGTDIQFKNLTTIGLGETFGSSWSFGYQEGGNNESQPSHKYLTDGNKTVKYLATSQFGCVDSISKTVTIIPAPIASFIVGQTCNVKPVIFTNTSTEPNGLITSYVWDFGDGLVSTAKNPQHNFPLTGKKTIKLTALANNGCITEDSKSITILPQPIANFETTDACIGEAVVFTNKTKGSGLVIYKWKFGDGDSSQLFSPVKFYKTKFASTYNVTLNAINIGGCSDAITLPVNIKETPDCSFTFASAGTGGFEFIFTPKNKMYPFYQWNFEGGGFSNDVSPRFKFEYDGKYRIRVNMRNADGCNCIDTSQFVWVNHLSSLKLNSSFGVKLYPNPSKGDFNLWLAQQYENSDFTLRIYGLTGQLLVEKTIINSGDHPIKLYNLPPGSYLLTLGNNQKLLMQTIITVVKE